MLWPAIAAVALANTPATDPDIAGNEDAPGEETVITDTDRHQRLTVPVLIEGEGPFDFMIDTGSEATVVARRLKDQLGLKSVGNAIVVGMASRVPAELVELDGLEFAARVIDGLEAPALEGRHIGADGILGLDSLQDLRVLIDFRAATIAVDDAKALGGDRGYEIVVRARRKLGRLIITEAKINNIRTAVIVDTGAQASIGNHALRDRLRSRERDTVKGTDVNGYDVVGTLGIARSLVVGDMELENFPILFADGPAFEQLGLANRPAMILGMQDLRLFDRVAIDFQKRRILFDLPSDVNRRPGVSFGEKASRL